MVQENVLSPGSLRRLSPGLGPARRRLFSSCRTSPVRRLNSRRAFSRPSSVTITSVQIGDALGADHPEKQIREADELAEAGQRLAHVGRLLRDVRLRAAGDGHEPRIAEVRGPIDRSEDLLHLLLEVHDLAARSASHPPAGVALERCTNVV